MAPTRRALSRRPGGPSPKVLVLCPRSDIAGSGIAIQRAFSRHSDIEVRQVRRVPKFYDYPHDAEWSERDALIEWADVVHVMEIPAAIPSGKPAVLHSHGSYARSNREVVLRSTATLVSSTLDLELMGLGTWLPAPYDLDWLASFRTVPDGWPDVLTIAHAPTNRAFKSTDAFLAACKRLSERVRVRVLLIEGQRWKACLRLKGMAHIYFDQCELGYGNNAIEAWGMGIPVVAGAQPETLAEMERRFGRLPFYATDEDSLYYALLDLVSSRRARTHYATLGQQHIRRFHDERVVVGQLEAVYRSLS